MPVTFDTAAAGPVLVLAGLIAAQALAPQPRILRRLSILLAAGLLLVHGGLLEAGGQTAQTASIGLRLLAAAAALALLARAIQSMPFALSAEARALRAATPGLPAPLAGPLMEAGRIVSAAHETPLTAEGRRADALYLVLHGRVRLRRGREAWERSAPCFVGGAGWLHGRPAETTAHLAPGARCVVWSLPRLQRTMRRSPTLARALEQAVAMDLAARRRLTDAAEEAVRAGSEETAQAAGPPLRAVAARGLRIGGLAR